MTTYNDLEAAVLPLLEAYEVDLTKHDRKAIEDNAGVPFLHWTRQHGTHIVFMPPSEGYPKEGERIPYLFGTADRWHIIKDVTVLPEHFLKPRNTPAIAVYHFDGQQLRKITVEKAKDIAYAYRYRIQTQWTSERRPLCAY